MPSLFNDPRGARHFQNVLNTEDLKRLDAVASDVIDSGGRVADDRLHFILREDRELVTMATQLLGKQAVPVRAVFFNKTAEKNWLTPWHQDRTIPVQQKSILPGYQTWSIKRGIAHVEPPIEILEEMVTLKVFLDDCPSDAGPIRLALGSHRHGRIQAQDAAALAEEHEVLACVAKRGDVWAHATPILHASGKSAVSKQRRILHIDFAGCELPSPLRWIRYA